jgi:hypothetical protein
MKKNCAFQYASNRQIFNDTDLITKSEAIELFNKNLPDFIDKMQELDGYGNVEMAIWCDMNSNTNYHKTLIHIHSDDCVIKNGNLYELRPVVKLNENT